MEQHLKYGRENLISALTILMNAITTNEYVPKEFKRGIIVPIPKGTKDATIMKNNRGITLLSVIAKLYEKLLNARFEPWAVETEIIHNLQGAAHKGYSSIHTTWLLREAISSNREQGSTVYVALLDTASAFDTVWINGMLVKFYKTGVDGKLWRLIYNFYDHFQCTVKVGGSMSPWFYAEQGVHQGAIWSMLLFEVAYNELIHTLCNSKLGCQIERVVSSNPTYADDIAIVSCSKQNLQALLDIANSYSIQWKFKFNVDKCELVVFSPDSYSNNDIKLGDEIITPSDNAVHMKIILSSCNVAIRDSRTRTAMRDAAAIYSLGSRKAPTPVPVASKLYWAIAIPRMLYGLEILTLSRTTVKSLETVHSSVAKGMQGLPKQSVNCGCLASVGWLSIETYLDFDDFDVFINKL